jgi:hypothetical protein
LILPDLPGALILLQEVLAVEDDMVQGSTNLGTLVGLLEIVRYCALSHGRRHRFALQNSASSGYPGFLEHQVISGTERGRKSFRTISGRSTMNLSLSCRSTLPWPQEPLSARILWVDDGMSGPTQWTRLAGRQGMSNHGFNLNEYAQAVS